MSLFNVVPELHGTSAYIGGECSQRGVQVQLAKWYPWRVEGSDEPMADSCGIFMCVPCAVAPTLGMDIFHEAWWTLDEHERNGGPGKALSTYLPKADDTRTNIAVPLGPAVAENPQKGKDKGKGKGKGKPNQGQALSVIENWTQIHGSAKGNSIMAPTSRWQHSQPM